MLINQEKCVGCGQCWTYCPVEAHYFQQDERGKIYSNIDQDKCVECGVCLRADVCPVYALYMPEELEMPRIIRALLSDPLIEFTESGVPGRGTAEIKTNEITGRIKYKTAGVALELGRPGVSTSWRDVDRVTTTLAKLGVGFCDENPVTFFMKDKKTGELREDVLDERSLSAIVEFDCSLDDLPEVLEVVKQVVSEIDTVVSLDVACKVRPEGNIPALDMIYEAGFDVMMGSKNNLGLGRPRFREDGES